MPKPKPQPIRSAMRRHPVTWATAASIAGVLAVMIPAVLWVDARYQLASAAERHEKEDADKHVQVLYGQQRIETLILRGRVNDCRQKATKLEYRAAAQRERVLYEQMQKGK